MPRAISMSLSQSPFFSLSGMSSVQLPTRNKSMSLRKGQHEIAPSAADAWDNIIPYARNQQDSNRRAERERSNGPVRENFRSLDAIPIFHPGADLHAAVLDLLFCWLSRPIFTLTRGERRLSAVQSI